MNTEASPPRGDTRYPFEVPVHVELARGFLRPADRVEGRLVDMSRGGAAIVLRSDPRLKPRKRYRVLIDDHAGIIAVSNITPFEDDESAPDDDLVRVGVEFKSLGLELQEIVADALQEAQWNSSRLDVEATSPLFTSDR